MLLKCCGSGSSGNSYALISDGGEILLIECGVPWKQILKMIDFRPSKVVGCICTHMHGDHILAYKELLQNGIQIYTNDETADHFEVVTGEKMIGVPEKLPFIIGNFTVQAFYLPHTTRDKDTGKIVPCPNFGYYITHEEMGDLVYMTDFEFPTMSFRQAKIQHLLCEVNYCDDLVEREEANYQHRLQGHLSLNTFKEKVLKQNLTPSMQTIMLCHLSDSAADEQRILREVKEIAGSRVSVNIAKPRFQCELRRFPF